MFFNTHLFFVAAHLHTLPGTAGAQEGLGKEPKPQVTDVQFILGSGCAGSFRPAVPPAPQGSRTCWEQWGSPGPRPDSRDQPHARLSCSLCRLEWNGAAQGHIQSRDRAARAWGGCDGHAHARRRCAGLLLKSYPHQAQNESANLSYLKYLYY